MVAMCVYEVEVFVAVMWMIEDCGASVGFGC